MTKGPKTSASSNTQRPSSHELTLVLPWYVFRGLLSKYLGNSAKLRKGEKRYMAENNMSYLFSGPRGKTVNNMAPKPIEESRRLNRGTIVQSRERSRGPERANKQYTMASRRTRKTIYNTPWVQKKKKNKK